jgi:centromere-localized protein 2
MDGPNDDANLAGVHNERSIVREMEVACTDLEGEVSAIDQETAEILEELNTTVGDLSDLRYGKFAKTTGSTDEFGKEVAQSVKRLQKVCDEAKYHGSVK